MSDRFDPPDFSHCPACDGCPEYEFETCRNCDNAPHGAEAITITVGKRAGEICEGVDPDDVPRCEGAREHEMCRAHDGHGDYLED